MMTKNYSKGAKRRAKKAPVGVPDLGDVPKRQPNGQKRDRADAPEDPRKTALQARVRRFGGEDTKSSRNALSDDFCGSQVGLVMKFHCPDTEAKVLWQTFRAWCAAEDQYRRRYIGQSEHPKGAAIAMVPDRMETDDAHTVDLRTPAERDRDAVTGWMRWQGYLGRLGQDQRGALNDARLERAGLWRDQKPTRRGMASLEALRALHVVVEGR